MRRRTNVKKVNNVDDLIKSIVDDSLSIFKNMVSETKESLEYGADTASRVLSRTAPDWSRAKMLSDRDPDPELIASAFEPIVTTKTDKEVEINLWNIKKLNVYTRTQNDEKYIKYWVYINWGSGSMPKSEALPVNLANKVRGMFAARNKLLSGTGMTNNLIEGVSNKYVWVIQPGKGIRKEGYYVSKEKPKNYGEFEEQENFKPTYFIEHSLIAVLRETQRRFIEKVGFKYGSRR